MGPLAAPTSSLHSKGSKSWIVPLCLSRQPSYPPSLCAGGRLLYGRHRRGAPRRVAGQEAIALPVRKIMKCSEEASARPPCSSIQLSHPIMVYCTAFSSRRYCQGSANHKLQFDLPSTYELDNTSRRWYTPVRMRVPHKFVSYFLSDIGESRTTAATTMNYDYAADMH
jgi:hypothetical protein